MVNFPWRPSVDPGYQPRGVHFVDSVFGKVLAEEIALIGVVMQYFSLWTALLLIVQIAFQLRRMYNEEAVLGENFPEYAIYKKKTARLIPGIY